MALRPATQTKARRKSTKKSGLPEHKEVRAKAENAGQTAADGLTEEREADFFAELIESMPELFR